jgi:eukaryotic-like serine/threonine-protein kinase
LDARRRILGPSHLDTLYSTNNLAGVLQDEGRYGEAEALYREALEGERRILGNNHRDIGIVWYNLAALAAHRKDRRNSLVYLKQALDHGYIDAEFMTTDEAWKSIRGDPEYRALFTQIQQRAADGQRTTAH